MQKLLETEDFQGRTMEKGDTVTLLSDNSSAKIADIAREGDQHFVCLRPLHQPYGKGVWHAADCVLWSASSRKPKKS